MTTFATGDTLPASFINASPRANLAQEDEVSFKIPLSCIRYANGTIPDATGAAGNPKIVMGGYGSGTGIFQGEDAQSAAKTETLCFDFAMPESYVAAETVKVSFSARYNDAGTNTVAQKSIDCEAYEIAEAGTAGSDICATAAQTLTGTIASYSFDITATGLTPGDLVRVFVRTILEGNTGGALVAEVGGATIKADLKG